MDNVIITQRVAERFDGFVAFFLTGGEPGYFLDGKV